eukprot:TRINITY_DN711_c0_g1_i8.p1 TRINITY_DN711_c0_g1~~TRINITY_DN711_c0_g1_i8.p1  ORF type:complete len:578 (+),score=102.22 TRINITY_DN711_c0_g1_i8:110-1843(+)
MVLGQSNFTSSGLSAPLNQRLFHPFHVFVWDQVLFVTCNSDHRVMIFEDILSLSTNGAAASHQIGQPDFDSTATRTMSNSSLDTPLATYYDGASKSLFVTSNYDERSLHCFEPLAKLNWLPSDSSSNTQSNTPSNTAPNSPPGTPQNTQSDTPSHSLTPSLAPLISSTATLTTSSIPSKTPSKAPNTSSNIAPNTALGAPSFMSFITSSSTATLAASITSIIAPQTASKALSKAPSLTASASPEVAPTPTQSLSLSCTPTSSASPIGTTMHPLASESATVGLSSSALQSQPATDSPRPRHSIAPSQTAPAAPRSHSRSNSADETVHRAKSSSPSKSTRQQPSEPRSPKTNPPSKTKSKASTIWDGIVVVKNTDGQEIFRTQFPKAFESRDISAKDVTDQVLQDQKKDGEEPQVISAVIDITVPKEQRKLDKPLKLCFTVDKKALPEKKQSHTPNGGCTKETVEKACLSYLNDKTFECVDDDIESEGSLAANKSKQVVCGYTPHLSSFAILLSASSESSCADNQAYFYTAIGLIGLTVLAIIVFLLLEWKLMPLKKMVLGEAAYKTHAFRKEMLVNKK